MEAPVAETSHLAGPGQVAGPGQDLHSVSFPALGTTAVLMVTRPDALDAAERILRVQLAELDEACSRFRADSEIVALTASAGRLAPVSRLLREALEAALRVAAATDGLVDPTVGEAVMRLGYDRDFAAIAPDGDPVPPARPAPGWWRVRIDRTGVLVPRGISLDLGSSAKAFAADRAARSIAAQHGCGVLVSLAGDLAVAGPAPRDGWLVSVGDDHRRSGPADQLVAVRSGGLATSSVCVRRWRRGGRTLHHIVDPRTGDVPAPVWRTVSVAAASCLDANAASTAAVVLAEQAPEWLAARAMPARLVGHDGRVTTVAGWPGDEPAGRVGVGPGVAAVVAGSVEGAR